MPYSYDTKKSNPGQSTPVQASREDTQIMPNSAMLDMIYNNDAAEGEAIRLSADVTATSPDAVKQEMGDLLNADFSPVQFHTDSASASKVRAMGVYAMAQGTDIYFGDGGFNPKIAAHELVHTVQQGAVDGDVEQTAPEGSVQFDGSSSGKKSSKSSGKKSSKSNDKKKDKKDKDVRNNEPKRKGSFFNFFRRKKLPGNKNTKAIEENEENRNSMLLENLEKIDEGLQIDTNNNEVVDENIEIDKNIKLGEKDRIDNAEEKMQERLNKAEFEELKGGAQKEDGKEYAQNIAQVHNLPEEEKSDDEDDDFVIEGEEKKNNSLGGMRESNSSNDDDAIKRKRRRDLIEIDLQNGLQNNKKYKQRNQAASAGDKDTLAEIFEEQSEEIGYARDPIYALNSAYQQAELANNPSYMDDNNFYTGQLNQYVNSGIDTMNAVTGLYGAYLSYKNIGKGIKDLKAGASAADAGTAAVDVLGSLGTSATGVVGNADRVQQLATNGAVQSIGPLQLVPGFYIASGAATALAGTVQGARAGSAVWTIKDQIKALKNKISEKKDSEKTDRIRNRETNLLNIFKQAKKASWIKLGSESLKVAGGGVSVALGAIALSGPAAPVTAAALGIASGVTATAKALYDRFRKKSAHRDVVLQYLNMRDWNQVAEEGRNVMREKIRRERDASKNKKNNNKNKKNNSKNIENDLNDIPIPNVTDKVARGAYLYHVGLGYTREEAFAKITERRAKYLIKVAESGDTYSELAHQVISTLGVHRKDGRYAEGAAKLLAEKLS